MKLIPYQDSGLWGFADTDLNIRVEPEYDRVWEFQHNYVVVEKSGLNGIINTKGDIVVPIDFEYIHILREDEKTIFRASKNNKCALFNEAGACFKELSERETVLLKTESTCVVEIANKIFLRQLKTGDLKKIECDEYKTESIKGMIAIKNNQGWSFIDGKAEMVISGPFEDVYYDSSCNDFILISEDELSGVMDVHGNIMIPVEYKNMVISCGHHNVFLAVDKNTEKHGILNHEGKVILDFNYDYVLFFDQVNRVIAIKNNSVAILDPSCNVLADIPGEWAIQISFNGNLIAIPKDGKWGVFNSDGLMVIDFVLESEPRAFDDSIIYEKDEKVGVVDLKGNKILAFEYDDIGFAFGFYVVEKNGRSWLCDKQGKKINDKTYSYISWQESEMIQVREGDKHGFINKNGEEIVPPIYDCNPEMGIGDLGGYSYVALEGENFCVDINGKEYRNLK